MTTVRTDIYLKLTGIFKTRTVAGKACKAGYVLIGGSVVKSSQEINRGDILEVVKPDGSALTIEILDIPSGKQVSRKERSRYYKTVGPEQ
jgi:ribosomal 50S subunit-recycling heat shock protein